MVCRSKPIRKKQEHSLSGQPREITIRFTSSRSKLFQKYYGDRVNKQFFMGARVWEAAIAETDKKEIVKAEELI